VWVLFWEGAGMSGWQGANSEEAHDVTHSRSKKKTPNSPVINRRRLAAAHSEKVGLAMGIKSKNGGKQCLGKV